MLSLWHYLILPPHHASGRTDTAIFTGDKIVEKINVLRPTLQIAISANQRQETASERFERKQRWDIEYASEATIPSSHRREAAHALVELIRAFDLGSGKALDLGCGNGRNARLLLDQGFQVTALDFADKALELVESWSSSELPGKNLSVINRDIYDGLPFQDSEYDVILDSYCLCHFTDIGRHKAALKECARVLKSGGYFVKLHIDSDDTYYRERIESTEHFGFVSRDPANGLKKIHTSAELYQKYFASDLQLLYNIKTLFNDKVAKKNYNRSIIACVFKKPE